MSDTVSNQGDKVTVAPEELDLQKLAAAVLALLKRELWLGGERGRSRR